MEKQYWRRWLFEYYHGDSLLNPHRRAAETFQLVRRSAYWDTLNSEINLWCSMCEVCHKYSSRAVLPPMRSLLADDQLQEVLLWTAMIIDVQGPFTKAETGEQYVISYHCTRLKVPKLDAIKSMQAGYFSRALSTCVFKIRTAPDLWRSDRGKELVNRVTEEFMAICCAKHIKGSPMVPRHLGMGE